eukprot:785351-Alexandrium_andersonii.AAC.1
MFEPVPIADRVIEMGPLGANPRELPNGLAHPYCVPTADRNVDCQRRRRIAGPNENAHGYEHPSEFEFTWLRPAPS